MRPVRSVLPLVAGLALLLGSSLLVVLAAGPASACSCARSGLGAQARAADLVVAGTVTDVDDGWWPGGSSTRDVTVAPDRVWRGRTPTGPVVLSAAAPDQGCGVDLAEGRRYLLFLSGSAGGLTTNGCSGTRPVTGAALAAADRRLGGGWAVDVPPEGPGRTLGPGARVAAGGGGLLLALVLVGAARRTASRRPGMN